MCAQIHAISEGGEKYFCVVNPIWATTVSCNLVGSIKSLHKVFLLKLIIFSIMYNFEEKIKTEAVVLQQVF